MTVGNTAAVFAPNLLRPEVDTLEHLADTAHVVNLMIVLIGRCPDIFGGTWQPAGGGAGGGASGGAAAAPSAVAAKQHPLIVSHSTPTASGRRATASAD